jgi:hypothetical protein
LPISACIVHGRLQVLWVAHLHVDADVVGQAADEELGALASRDARRMACQRLKAVGEILHRGGEGEATELGQPAPAYRGYEPEEAKVVEALPWRHPALVLLEGVVPCLGGAVEVVGGDPRAVGRQCPLPPEKLVALVEPVQGATVPS